MAYLCLPLNALLAGKGGLVALLLLLGGRMATGGIVVIMLGVPCRVRVGRPSPGMGQAAMGLVGRRGKGTTRRHGAGSQGCRARGAKWQSMMVLGMQLLVLWLLLWLLLRLRQRMVAVRVTLGRVLMVLTIEIHPIKELELPRSKTTTPNFQRRGRLLRGYADLLDRE